jgi:peptidyl-prolyl cis-trans isomerase C
MKKTMSLLIVALIGIFISVGCSEKKSETAKPVAADSAVTELKARSDEAADSSAAVAEKCETAAKSTAPADIKKDVKSDAAAEGAKAVESAKTAVKETPVPEMPKAADGVTLKDFLATLKLPEVVATVGDEKITKEQLVKEIESQVPPFMRGKPLPPQAFAQLADNLPLIVDSIISRNILLGMAAADGIKPSPEMLTKRFDKFIKDMQPAQKQMFEQQLKAQGSSIEKRRKEILSDVNSQSAAAIDTWITEKIMPGLKVDDAAVEKYYRENQESFKKPETIKVAHILIAPERPSMEKMQKMSDDEKKAFAENADKKAKAKAEEILAKLKQGGDFAKLAKENSICPSKNDGGALPEFDKTGAMVGGGGGRMDKVFTDASYKLKKGDLSDVVKTGFGYHIIKALEHNKESYIPLDTIKGYLKDNLQKEQLGKKIKSIVDSEKEKKKVKILIKGKTAPAAAPVK